MSLGSFHVTDTCLASEITVRFSGASGAVVKENSSFYLL